MKMFGIGGASNYQNLIILCIFHKHVKVVVIMLFVNLLCHFFLTRTHFLKSEMQFYFLVTKMSSLSYTFAFFKLILFRVL